MLGLSLTALTATAESLARRREANFAKREKNLALDVVPISPVEDYPVETTKLCLYDGMKGVARQRRWTKLSFSYFWDNNEVVAINIKPGHLGKQSLSLSSHA